MFDPYNSNLKAYIRIRKKIYNFYVYPEYHNVEYLNKVLNKMRNMVTRGLLGKTDFTFVRAELKKAYESIGDNINKH